MALGILESWGQDNRYDESKSLDATFETAVQPFPSNRPHEASTPDQSRALLRNHLADGGAINIRRYAALAHLTPVQAAQELKALAAEGFLIPSGTSTHRIYLLARECAPEQPPSDLYTHIRRIKIISLFLLFL